MNTSKNKIEQQIKKQIEEREIAPTRDLWVEIENQTSMQIAAKQKINWYLVAASLGLLLSLGIIFITKDNDPITPIVETKTHSEIVVPPRKIEKEETKLLVEKAKLGSIKIDQISPTQKAKISEPQVAAVKNEIPETLPQQTILEKAKNQVSSSIAILDSAKIPTKRKRFVDPSTLLFSVEHKDVIEKSKDGSNVATIDLNSN
ncbi:hypothetical protein [Kaistella yonginensis]|uniref:hypothetical protein n=1 Tax=Kaistella yonginensis TaxID=658267 RepID=UPI0025B40204|nr:hypothetical protein [Kaistella yonginensis]MDN3606024.1 hypothetical protein [Kaistella yonginensis]